ncbi:hypothetical protein HXX76_013141 [Chlamydomonas incerta]|uniref:Spindle and kinetochore-associated protein 3 n=1 Tax=Chlamydomonas incerta TaxID=51695 RepID=A0A835VSH6_CHLIN|nr:hypothetical protein HXX76_013141 [Chlamydomonas incerta]|eukprot:KAG2426160.1 hypothetical protein HXX76_013141 [Chlamydomonas incerta]
MTGTSKRKPLHSAVKKFADDLRGLTTQLNEGVNFLNRATQLKPCAGARDFREAISDLQDEVTELTTEAEHLERFTVDAISFEELLGHCLALYQDNRSSIQRLEAHLGQYGYSAPPGLQVEPENPVAAAAAAASRRRGTSGSDLECEDEEADGDVYATARVAVTATASRHAAIKPAAAASSKGSRQVVMVTPGVAKPRSGGNAASSRRSATPAGRLGKVLPDSDEDEDDDMGMDTRGASDNDDDSDGMELEGGVGGGRGGRRTGVSAAASGMGPRPMGSLAGKGQLLAGAQAASWATALTAAASVRASARKAPRPSVDSRGSATPEAMLMSPSLAQLLAKYNPPSDADPGLAMAPSTGDPPAAARGAGGQATGAAGRGGGGSSGSGAAGNGGGTEELAAAMRGLSPFGRGARLAQQPQQRPRAAAAAPQPQAAKPVQQQPQPQPLVVAAVAAPAPALAAIPQHSRFPTTRSPTAAAFGAFGLGDALSQDASIASNTTPPPTSGGAAVFVPPRSVTPLRSVPRADWQEHDKVLAEKMAGLEMTWVTSGQAGRANTPLRSDLRRSFTAEGAVGGGAGEGGMAGIAAAMAAARPLSPAPSRAATEAFAAAALFEGERYAAPASSAWASQPAPLQPAPQQAPAPQPQPAFQRRPVAPINVTALDDGDMVRVLSPVQKPAPSPRRQPAAATPPGRAGSRLPTPGGGGAAQVSTTVVGATVTPRRDAAASATSASSGLTPKGGAKQGSHGLGNGQGAQPRGTPSKRSGSGIGGGGCSTPVRGSQLGASPSIAGARPATPPGRGLTPERVTRATSVSTRAAAAAAAAASSTASATSTAAPAAGARAGTATGTGAGAGVRGTPSGLRKSWNSPLSGLAQAEAEQERGASNITPSRIGRGIGTSATASASAATAGAAAASSGVGANRTPGRARPSEAQAQAQAQPARTAATAPTTAAPTAPVPALKIPGLTREDTWGSAEDASDSRTTSAGGAGPHEWRGFAAPAPTPAAGMTSAGGASEFEVMLSMPPVGTPTAQTPGRGEDGGGGAAPLAAARSTSGIGGGGGGGLPAAVLAGLSPGTSQLVSRALGEAFRPQTAAAGLGSRIPAPTATQRPATAISTTGSAPAQAATDARRATGTTAAAVAAAATLPLPSGGSCSVTLCSEEDWRLLPTRTQAAFPLDTINQHLRRLSAGRPAAAGAASYFAVSDVEALSADMTTTGAKLLINTLVKLGRCEVAAAAGGVMQYRIKP